MAGAVNRNGVEGRVAAYASLVRLPNLFTAPPDVILGASLAVVAGYAVSFRTVVGLAAASILLYAAGTTLNDYADAGEDAELRPERPIPSGDVSRQEALALGGVLLVSGVVVAFATAGTPAAIVASVLAVTIVLYDGVLKGGAAGFAAMGATRAINVAMGVTAAGIFPFAVDWLVVVPLVVGGYIASVTYMAAHEAETTEKKAVAAAIIGTAVAGFTAITVPHAIGIGPIDSAAVLVLVTVFFAWTGRALRAAYHNPIPETVGGAIGRCILGLVVLNAAFATAAGLIWTTAAIIHLVPAIGLTHMFDVT